MKPLRYGRFNLHEVAASFPATSETLLMDIYLTDEPAASTRVFRVYRQTPPHYHVNSDERLYVLSGTGTFWIEDPTHTEGFAPGDLLFFKRGTIHAMPRIYTEPVVFLALDTPRRDPGDITFVESEDGTPESFISPFAI